MFVHSSLKAPRSSAFLGIACCLLAAGLPAARAQDALATTRKQFVDAYAAVQPGPQHPVQPGDDAIGEYPLYPYLQAARLQKALAAAATGDSPADAETRDFLAQHAGEAVASPVRRDWLASLGRRELWAGYLAAAPEPLADPALNCLWLTARIETGRTTDLAPLVIKQWLSADQLPGECERPFTWLRGEGALTEALIEQRVRMSLAKGNARFARMIARDLPAPQAAPLLQWAALLEQPRREIDALMASRTAKVEPAALLAGWTRLVTVDFDYARTRFAAFTKARGLDHEAASPYALALALRLSWNRHADAPAFFARVRDADFDDVGREWHARAALWSGNWREVTATVAAMPPALGQTPRWRYWAARAAAATGDADAAHRLYVSILSADNYYSAMAAAHLEQAFTPNPAPVPADEAELGRIAALPPFVRARELLLAGMRTEALMEWQHGVRNLPSASQPQVVHLGMRWRWYDVSIATATQQRIFDDYSLLYPRPYDADVSTAVASSGLPTELVYGVLRQESLYRPDAISSAGAVGLLQMLPETARRTARRAQHPVPRPSDLLNPAINVRLGAAHLKELIDQFGGQVPLALAGYNAGPGAALRWLPEQPMDTDVWIENIPFNETRTYVQRILWHTVVFSWLGSGQPQVTQAWLTEVSRSSWAGRATAGDRARAALTTPGFAASTANPQ
jgi:soluble lytic murein transglycosylase